MYYKFSEDGNYIFSKTCDDTVVINKFNSKIELEDDKTYSCCGTYSNNTKLCYDNSCSFEEECEKELKKAIFNFLL